jgi:hypothetical protein
MLVQEPEVNPKYLRLSVRELRLALGIYSKVSTWSEPEKQLYYLTLHNINVFAIHALFI